MFVCYVFHLLPPLLGSLCNFLVSQLLTFSGHVSFRNRPMVSETKIKKEKVFIPEAKRKQFNENCADASSY